MTYFIAVLLIMACVYAVAAPSSHLRTFRHNTHIQKMVDDEGSELSSSQAALCLELLSVLLKSGVSLNHSLGILATQGEEYKPLLYVARALERGLDWESSWQQVTVHTGWEILARELKFAHQAAVPTAMMLTAAAEQIRGEERQRITEKSQEISGKLVLPTGLLALPAFICWGVLPAVLALFDQTDWL